MKKPWGGRFEEETDPGVEQFTESISVDHLLYREDIRASLAHAEMLAENDLLDEEELAEIQEGLRGIRADIEDGELQFDAALEDVHMNMEAELVDRIGDAGRKLHTARSRNDQVACDLRLWVRKRISHVKGLLRHCQRELVCAAERHTSTVLPGFTHLQHAQPLLLSHLLLAYVNMFERDRGRLDDCRARTNVSPLGACALAGTALPIDPESTAAKLDFAGPFDNSVDAVSDRDFVVEYVSALSLLACHLSRLAEEWTLWAGPEFEFLSIGDAFCTGSSIMPQKKNPDVLELIRGKCGRVYGNLTTLLTMLKGQPLAYNRDLQEDKTALFDADRQVSAALSVLQNLIPSCSFNTEKMEEACQDGYPDATALADYLVRKGVPFRKAHELVGQVVRQADEHGVKLSELSLETLQYHSSRIEDDVYNVLGAHNCVQSYRSHGSSAPAQVKRQIAEWKEHLELE